MSKSVLTVISSCLFPILILFRVADAGATYIGRLDNGMDVALVENHSVQMIGCNIVIKAGARDETWHTWGAAHFLEHLLFNGTKNRTQEEIYAEFDRLGAWNNAHTAQYFVDFMLLASDKNFPAGFDVLTDMIFNSNLPQHKFEKERGIVMEEIAQSRMRGSDDDLIFKEALFGESPLSREVLGTVESIERLERDSVLAFYHRWYVPNNMMLFVSGNFKADTLFDWLQDQMKAFPPKELSPRLKFESPNFNRLNIQYPAQRFYSGDNNKLCLFFPAPLPSDSDYPAFYMFHTVLNKRFKTELPDGFSAYSDFNFDPDFAVYQINVSSPDTLPVNEKPVMDIVLKLLNDTKSSIDREELARLALNYRADRIINSEKLHHYGIMYAHLWSLISWDEWESLPDKITKVIPVELLNTGKKWINEKECSKVLLKPYPRFIEESSDTAASTAIKYKRFISDNGLTTIVKSDPTAQVFAVHVLIKDRWLYEKKYGVGSVDILHRMFDIPIRGKNKSISRRIEELAATLKVSDSPYIPFDDYYSTPEYSFVRLEVLPEYWREGIELLGDMFAELTPTEEALQIARQNSSASAGASSRSASRNGNAKLKEHFFPETAWSAEMYCKDTSYSLSALSELKKQYFQPGNMIISVGGPISSALVKDAIESDFSKLSDNKVEHINQQPFKVNPEALNNTVWRDTVKLGGRQGAVVMGRVIPEVDSADAAALLIANAYFNERMGQVLRETLGLAYSLGSGISLRPFNRNHSSESKIWAYWNLSINTRQDNLERAEDEINVLLEELMEHDFTDEEVEKLQNAINGRFMMRGMSQMGQAYYLGTGEFIWNDPDWSFSLIDQIGHVTAQEVESAARKYLQQNGMSVVIVQ
ncbi:insulinase family protein [bacterium]|nr:insulinase family protein [bacterium]